MRKIILLSLGSFIGGLLLSGCPTPPTQPMLLGSIDLNEFPSALAVDSSRNRGYVTDGRRVRAMNLDTRSLVPTPSDSGNFLVLDPEDDLYGVLSSETGQALNLIGYRPNLTTAGQPFGMSYDAVSNSVFVVDNFAEAGATSLFQVDLETFERTSIGEPGFGENLRVAGSLALDDSSGMLYTVDAEDYLWRIDPESATADRVGRVSDFTNVQGLSFSPDDGELYGIDNLNPNVLVRIDVDTGDAVEVASLPLGYALDSLTFKPDGTLWGADLVRDALIEINPTTGAVITEFERYPVARPIVGGEYLLAVLAMTFVPNGVPGGFLVSGRDPEAVTVLNDGALIASSTGHVTRLEMDLSQNGSADMSGLLDFEPLVTNSTTGLVYARDGLDGSIFEIDPIEVEILREISLREPRSNFPSTFTPEMDIDPDSNRLFVRDPEGLFVVDLDAPTAEAVDLVPLDFVPEGVQVDSERGLLILNNLGSGLGGAAIEVRDIDTFELMAERALGNQLHWMDVDETGGRLAVNVRVTTSFITEVMLLSLPSLTPIDYGLELDGDGTTRALLAIDPGRGQLVVTRGTTPPSVDFYELP